MRQDTLPVDPAFSLAPRTKPECRNKQLVRQWQLLKLLGRRTWSLHELAEELQVCARTIRRDIHCLEEAHFPITQRDNGRWGVMPRSNRPSGLLRDLARDAFDGDDDGGEAA